MASPVAGVLSVWQLDSVAGSTNPCPLYTLCGFGCERTGDASPRTVQLIDLDTCNVDVVVMNTRRAIAAHGV